MRITGRDSKRHPRLKESSRLSKDGQWFSFSKVPNLLMYVPNGNYYARTKLNGKVIRRSLETTTFSKAKLRLLDFLKAQKQLQSKTPEPILFREARELYEQRLANDPAIKPKSRDYRLQCLLKLMTTWPGIDDQLAHEISIDECRDWAAKLDLSSHLRAMAHQLSQQSDTPGVHPTQRANLEGKIAFVSMLNADQADKIRSCLPMK